MKFKIIGIVVILLALGVYFFYPSDEECWDSNLKPLEGFTLPCQTCKSIKTYYNESEAEIVLWLQCGFFLNEEYEDGFSGIIEEKNGIVYSEKISGTFERLECFSKDYKTKKCLVWLEKNL